MALVVPAGCGLGFAMRHAYWTRHGSWVRHRHEINHLIDGDDPPLVTPVAELDQHERRVGALRRLGVWRDPLDRFTAVHGMYAVNQQPSHQLWFAGVPGIDLRRFLAFAELELGKKDPATQHPAIRRQAESFTATELHEFVETAQLPDVLRSVGLTVPRWLRVVRRTSTKMPDDVAVGVRELYAADLAYRESARRR